MRRRMRTAASFFFFLRRRLGRYPGASCVGRGSPKMPPAEQRRRCSYRSLERILCVLGLSLGSRAVWAIELVGKLGLRPPFLFEAPPPEYAVLWSVGVGAAGAPVAIR